jgi:protein-S-isoprenylcysteine O-methyltransferase Ste14
MMPKRGIDVWRLCWGWAALALLVAGLDARFNWSQDFEMPLKIIALIVILAGNILGTYALMENRFFSRVVRLQTDRDQHVVSSGPYRFGCAIQGTPGRC